MSRTAHGVPMRERVSAVAERIDERKCDGQRNDSRHSSDSGRATQRHLLLRLRRGGCSGQVLHRYHDRRAEARVIRETFGDIATFVVWAERYLPKIDQIDAL